MKGWTCPSCGRGVAPTEKTCDHGGALKARDYLPPDPSLTLRDWQLYRPVGGAVST